MKVTRSFGDFEAKKVGVTHEPEITDIQLSKDD
jgi:serine/threonine protein phosphatase PrpC